MLAPSEAYRLARPHALRAIALAPNAAEGHAALGLIEQWQPSKAVASLSRAVGLDPARAEVRLWLAGAYSQLGRNSEALEHYQALEELEPLWQPAIAHFTISLVAAGELERARQIVDRFERRGGREGEAEVLRGRFAEMTGDLSGAITHLGRARRLEPQMTYTKMLLAWYYHLLGLAADARASAAGEAPLTQLYLSPQRKPLLEALTEKPHGWGGQDWDVAVAALAQARDWRKLEQLYEQWRNQPHEGCLATFSGGITAHRRAAAMAGVNFAVALRSRGRGKEAQALLTCLKANIARQRGGPIRHYSLSEPIAAFMEAQIFAIEGDRTKSLNSLAAAIDHGWRGWHSSRLDGYSALDPLRSLPEFKQIQARLDSIIAEERAQALRAKS